MLPVPAPDDVKQELSKLVEAHKNDTWHGYTITLIQWLGDQENEEPITVKAMEVEQKSLFSV